MDGDKRILDPQATCGCPQQCCKEDPPHRYHHFSSPHTEQAREIVDKMQDVGLVCSTTQKQCWMAIYKTLAAALAAEYAAGYKQARENGDGCGVLLKCYLASVR
jgi:hypothetical protein